MTALESARRANNARWDRSGAHRESHRTPEYQAWKGMKRRCANSSRPDYKYYGGRGIAVYPGWLNDYPSFLAHIGRRPSPNHSIERINNDLGYQPGNVRWATKLEQMGNTRRNRRINFSGQSLSIEDWARRTGISARKLQERLAAGWPTERVLDPRNFHKGQPAYKEAHSANQ